jgi:outer membrane protein assembly factor BamA
VSSEYTSALDQRTNALGGAADIRDRNFLGRGMSLGGGLRFEPDLRSARALFSVPTLRGRPIRTNLFLNGRGEEQRDEQLNARDDEVKLSIEQRWRASRAIEYSWGYSSTWRDARLTQATGEQSLDFNGILASLNGAAVIDRRDSFFDAKRGWFGSVSLQWGQQEFGSDVDYLRTLMRGSYYQPLGPIVLAGNVRWGQLVPLGGQFTLTIFDLFFNAGGTESVRGYSQDALSAYSFFDAPLGGTKLLVGNAELRAPLFWRLGGVLFADAGNTFANAQPIRLNDLGVGLGFGLRINTPLAPIRIDLGFPRSFGETGVRWHFSIGQMF